MLENMRNEEAESRFHQTNRIPKMMTKTAKSSSTKALKAVALDQGELPPLRDKTAEETEIQDLLSKNLLNDKNARSKVASQMKAVSRKTGKSVTKNRAEPLIPARVEEKVPDIVPKVELPKEVAKSDAASSQMRKEKDSMLSEFFKNKKAMK